MGRYNPNKPPILGMEWTPLIDAPIDIDLDTEWGYSFTVTGAPFDVLNRATALVNSPSSAIAGQTLFCSVYPRGREDDTGQIRVIRFLANSVQVTGVVITGGASSFTDALTSSSDTGSLVFDALADKIRVSFDVNEGMLTGKRILGVDLAYQAAGTPGFALEPSLESFTVVYPYGPVMTGPPTLDIAQTSTIRLGDVNPFWNNAADPNTEETRFPWRASELERLDGGTPRVFVGVRPSTIPLGGNAQLGFLALDVYYCEESRVRYGGLACGNDNFGLDFTSISDQTVTMTLRDTNFQVTGGLPPGDYTVTLTQADVGSRFNAGGRINLPRTYQLNEVMTHPGVQVTKFQRPVGVKPAVAPVSQHTPYMTPVALAGDPGSLNLQAGSAPVTYTSVVGAPVYVTTAGVSIFAQQPVHNEASPADTTYEQVRFYARRFNPLAPGNLTITVSGSGSATITPAQFALLPEINIGENGAGTGWREVTLPITAVFSSDATFRPVTWTMTGVTRSDPIDQWQILTSLTTIAPSYPNVSLYALSRYDGLQNASLTWDNGRFSSGAVSADQNATATVFFSQDPPAPTGLAITHLTQAVTGIGLDCGSLPNCIPTGIAYNHVAWSPDNFVVCDSFSSRTVTGSWGTSETGQPWTFTGTGATPFVSGGAGYINVITPGGGSTVFMTTGSFVDSDETITFTVPAIPTVASYRVGMVARYTNTSNWYMARIELNTSGLADLELYRNVAGTTLELTQLNNFLSFAAGTRISVRFQVTDGLLRAKTWNPDAGPEPLTWTLAISDSSLAGPGAVGLRISEDAGSLPSPYLLAFDDFVATDAKLHNAQFELQRKDDIDDVWQTVMLTPICNLDMDDYEMRVGVENTYRIRICNESGFCGPWSTEVVDTLPAPGVSGIGNGNSVLLFTSNQGPSGNLAYVMTWEGTVREEFEFPESAQVQLRTQYQRDFYTAFHGTERGGEAFSRSILVQAAAIPPESLANFKNLRDLAWADLPYVCVRDELGNRWYANVRVPNAVVRRNRRLYVANIDIVEVTDTPAPVTT